VLQRRLLAVVVLLGLPAAAAALGGPRGAGWGLLASGVLVVAVLILLPRAGHRAFANGNHTAARRRYRVVSALALTRRRAAHARLSMAACDLAEGAHARAMETLAGLDAGLDADARAVWLNNRAYAALRCPELAIAPTEALAWADEAVTLRPDVPAIGHTRGLALLEIGRLDEAIRVLEELWGKEELAPRLEAERCRDLARAWRAKGHADYAADYEARGRKFAA
jgi:tetratricopeptide (TPR) repeat protein